MQTNKKPVVLTLPYAVAAAAILLLFVFMPLFN